MTHPIERRNTQRTARHLRLMSAEFRAQLEREWAEGGDAALRIVNEPISPAIRARAAAEWETL